MARPDVPMVVQLPKAGADHPAWAKVGIVALVGFVCGIVWPRFMGTRIAPPLPTEASARASEAAPPVVSRTETFPVASGGVAAPAAAPAVSAAASSAAGELAITVGRGAIVRCRDTEDEALTDCGSLQFDPIAVPVLKSLTHCASAPPSAGQLSVGFDVDFRRHRVRPMLGKATTLPSQTAQGLLACADAGLKSAALSDVKHRYRRYAIYYTATFAPAEQRADPPAATTPEHRTAGTTTNETPMTGSATVAWEVAVVRETPRSGSVVARVLRGTKVRLVARQGEWLRIRTGTTEGWAYRGALGM
jgi:hypothetical protein